MIQVKTKKGEEWMSMGEFSRWMCLVEAFHFIEKKSNELNIDSSDMVKSLAIEKYINERYLSMLHDINVEHKMGNL